MHHSNYSQATTAEYNDEARIVGANAVLLYASDPREPKPDETSVVALDPSQIRLAFGDPEQGPKLVLDASGITLTVGPAESGTSIKLTKDSITLTAGKCTLTLSASDGFTGDINQGTTFAYAPSGIKSSTPKVEVKAEGSMKLSGMEMKLSGMQLSADFMQSQIG